MKFAPVHLKARPCATFDADGGGPRTWRADCVNCPECAPAAAELSRLAELVGSTVGGVLLIGLAFLAFSL